MGTITDKLNKLAETKSAIKTAIVNKGVAVSDSDTFASYANKIASISGGGSAYEFDFTVLGYDNDECNDANEIANYVINNKYHSVSEIEDGILYGKELYDSNYEISNENVDKDRILFYPKLTLPYRFNYSNVLYIPNITINWRSYNTGSDNYINYHLIKIRGINGFVSANKYSINCLSFKNCYFLKSIGNIDLKVTDPEYDGILYSTQDMFMNCVSLVEIPNIKVSTCSSLFANTVINNWNNILKNIDTSKSSYFDSMFYNSNIGKDSQIFFNTSLGKNFREMFYNCIFMESYNFGLDLHNANRVDGMFGNDSNLKSIDSELNTENAEDFNSMFYFCHKLIKIASLSLKSLNTTIEYYYLTGWSEIPTLRYVLLKDFGTGSGCTSASFTYLPNWGIEDETIPLSAGARQSLVDTFITYSYDRATAGYATCTVTLSTNTKALLTEDEIAQITAKGYTLA